MKEKVIHYIKNFNKEELKKIIAILIKSRWGLENHNKLKITNLRSYLAQRMGISINHKRIYEMGNLILDILREEGLIKKGKRGCAIIEFRKVSYFEQIIKTNNIYAKIKLEGLYYRNSYKREIIIEKLYIKDELYNKIKQALNDYLKTFY